MCGSWSARLKNPCSIPLCLGKRGRETSMCGCFPHAPCWGPGPQPQCLLIGLETEVSIVGPPSQHCVPFSAQVKCSRELRDVEKASLLEGISHPGLSQPKSGMLLGAPLLRAQVTCRDNLQRFGNHLHIFTSITPAFTPQVFIYSHLSGVPGQGTSLIEPREGHFWGNQWSFGTEHRGTCLVLLPHLQNQIRKRK